MNEIKVIELFAGVGGFRLGLMNASNKYKFVWSNQWEPAKKTQTASFIYVREFGPEGHSNEDIAKVELSDIPEHDLLVGGFPCQDYSVARTLNQSSGLEGKKGVLWWEIHRIIKGQKHKPGFIFLENVDRLLISPSKQRGRDFAVMLASLSDLGYAVEWRVINAADYGMPQRRKRTFLLGYHKSTPLYVTISKLKDKREWVLDKGTLAEAFKVLEDPKKTGSSGFELNGDLEEISTNFNTNRSMPLQFENAGIMIDRKVVTLATKAQYNGPFTTLGDKILLNGSVPKEYFIDEKVLERWAYLKGAKNEKRKNKATGFEYQYTEGGMVFPDPLDKPSRTIITAEGGASPSRFKHVIRTKEGRLRRLTPIELERLNMFPDNHTKGASDIQRAFLMGNALVVGVVEKIGKTLIEKIG